MRIIVMVVCAMLAGCYEETGDVPPGPELVLGTYELGQTFNLSADCQGTLPFVNTVTLQPDGTADLADSSGGSTVARWSATADGFMLEGAQAFAWSATDTTFELGEDGETYQASMTWWNSTTRQSCVVETWARHLDVP